MDNCTLNFFDKIERMSRKEYIKCFITYLVAPVLSGLKPSSTITFTNNKNSLYDDWNEYGKDFIDSLGLKFQTLKNLNNGEIILIYNEFVLENHLLMEKNKQFLCDLGYGKNITLDACLKCLKNKFKEVCFPHESGIFLGIPLEDVIAFMEKEINCVFCGYWKVYYNYEKAINTFKLYDESKEIVARAIYEEKDIKEIAKSIKNIYIEKHYSA